MSVPEWLSAPKPSAKPASKNDVSAPEPTQVAKPQLLGGQAMRPLDAIRAVGSDARLVGPESITLKDASKEIREYAKAYKDELLADLWFEQRRMCRSIEVAAMKSHHYNSKRALMYANQYRRAIVMSYLDGWRWLEANRTAMGQVLREVMPDMFGQAEPAEPVYEGAQLWDTIARVFAPGMRERIEAREMRSNVVGFGPNQTQTGAA